MTRKEYEEEQNRLYAIMYEDDISKNEREEAWLTSEKLRKQYSHYEKQLFEETIDILKGGTIYTPTKRRERKCPIKFVTEGF